MNRRRAPVPEVAVQLHLSLESSPASGDDLLERLRSLGLSGISTCRLTSNRAVMISYTGTTLRIHRSFLRAPADVLAAVVTFLNGRTRGERRQAQARILRFPVHVHAPPPVRRPERARPEDAPLVRELQRWHEQYNQRYFDDRLAPIAIRISGRMKSRLGQYTAATSHGDPAEIAISRLHLRRHGWAEALHTLLHEMVHQWQAETGIEIDHGPRFRAKARAVGITPYARREVACGTQSRRGAVVAEGLRAASRG